LAQFILYFLKFITRVFDFKGRSSRPEYWSVMPVLWVVMLIALWGDILKIEQVLLQRQIPSLNPFHYTSILIFFVTLVPRLSLNIRRLHDSGRSCIFVIVPVFVMFSVLALVSGMTGAMMNSSLTGISDGPDDPANVIYPIRLYLSSPPLYWAEVFEIAKVFDATGITTISNLVEEILAQNGRVDIRRENTDLSIGIFGSFTHTFAMILIYAVLLLTPVSSMLTHMVFGVIGSNPKANRYGLAPNAAISDQSGLKDPPLSKREIEINALYQKRILKER